MWLSFNLFVNKKRYVANCRINVYETEEERMRRLSPLYKWRELSDCERFFFVASRTARGFYGYTRIVFTTSANKGVVPIHNENGWLICFETKSTTSCKSEEA